MASTNFNEKWNIQQALEWTDADWQKFASELPLNEVISFLRVFPKAYRLKLLKSLNVESSLKRQLYFNLFGTPQDT